MDTRTAFHLLRFTYVAGVVECALIRCLGSRRLRCIHAHESRFSKSLSRWIIFTPIIVQLTRLHAQLSGYSLIKAKIPLCHVTLAKVFNLSLR